MNTENKIVIFAFTVNGINSALRLSKFFEVRIFVPERFFNLHEKLEKIDGKLSDFVGKIFHEVRALIFISACGIAVRSISEHIENKMKDPAVIVIDEKGKFVIPVLSGHVGGANELAKKISDLINAVPVITTATDINNSVSVDEWAVKNNCEIENPDVIKKISGKILEGHEIGVAVTEQNQPVPFPVTLILRPKNLILGAGCNRGINAEEFENAAKNFLDSSGVSVLSLKALASINIKSNEPALISFAENHNIPFITFSASELQSLKGNFTRSEKVLSITGTDNICERACMKAAGENAVMLRSKIIYNGITLALAKTSKIQKGESKIAACNKNSY